MTPRADLANGVAGVVVVGALLSMESGTVPIGGGVGSQLAKVVAVGVQRSSLYILYTLPPRIQSPDLSQSKRTERAHRPSRDTESGLRGLAGFTPTRQVQGSPHHLSRIGQIAPGGTGAEGAPPLLRLRSPK